jgi:hypothetical protein
MMFKIKLRTIQNISKHVAVNFFSKFFTKTSKKPTVNLFTGSIFTKTQLSHTTRKPNLFSGPVPPSVRQLGRHPSRCPHPHAPFTVPSGQRSHACGVNKAWAGSGQRSFSSAGPLWSSGGFWDGSPGGAALDSITVEGEVSPSPDLARSGAVGGC